MQFANQSNTPNTLAEKIEDAMGFRSKVQSVSLGIKLGVLTAVLMALYFFIFKMFSFDNYVFIHLSKFFVIGAIMFLGFVLFKPRKQQPSFYQGVKLAGVITFAAAISFLSLQLLFVLIGSPAYLEPEMYGQAIGGGADIDMTISFMMFISFLEILIYGMISGIGNILYFTRPLKTSAMSSNENELDQNKFNQSHTAV